MVGWAKPSPPVIASFLFVPCISGSPVKLKGPFSFHTYNRFCHSNSGQ